MTNDRSDYEFTDDVKMAALKRQGYLCAMCGSRIWRLGKNAKETHRFREASEAHHMLTVGKGRAMVINGEYTKEEMKIRLTKASNCVILCWSCHYTAHEGNFLRGDLLSTKDDYEFFYVRKKANENPK